MTDEWRPLRVGEVVCDDDQYLGWANKWGTHHTEHTGRIMKAAFDCYFFRRRVEKEKPMVEKKIEVGEGYRLLSRHERLEQGDEFSWDLAWKPTGDVGLLVGDRIGVSYRRKIVSAQVEQPQTQAPVATPIPESILDEAKRIIGGDRCQDYGEARDSFERIAGLWSEYLKHRLLGPLLSPLDVDNMMVLLKVARGMRKGTQPVYKRDSYVDIAGYAGLADQLVDK